MKMTQFKGRPLMMYSLITLLVLFLALAVILVSNLLHTPHWGRLRPLRSGSKGPAPAELSIVTWNVGYGALGAKADISISGGKHLRSLAKSEIAELSVGISELLASFDADYFLIQETAGASFLNRGIDLKSQIDSALGNYTNCYWQDFATVLVPSPFRFDHGMSVYSRFETSDVDSCHVLQLPQGKTYYGGVLKKYYAGIVHRIPIKDREESWVVINIHLTAFDKGAGSRRAQLSELFNFALKEFEKGNHVIIGGDWNMRLSRKEFPFKTPPVHDDWIYDLPKELVPDGWHLAFDEDFPSVRTCRIPYERDNNFTMIIDGFAYSPNVSVVKVTTTNLEFKFSDHQPVKGVFRAN